MCYIVQCLTNNVYVYLWKVLELMRRNILSSYLSIFQLHTLIQRSQAVSLHLSSNVHYFSWCYGFSHLWKDLANPKNCWFSTTWRKQIKNNLYPYIVSPYDRLCIILCCVDSKTRNDSLFMPSKFRILNLHRKSMSFLVCHYFNLWSGSLFLHLGVVLNS